MHVDIAFPFAVGVGKRLPLDHGYSLFSALSHCVTDLHSNTSWAMALVASEEKLQRGGFMVTSKSCIRLRVPVQDVPKALPLMGHEFSAFDQEFALGDPTIHSLIGAPTLFSPLVTFTGMDLDVDEFQERVSNILRGIAEDQEIDVRIGRHRRMRVHGVSQGGFAVWVDGLDRESSLKLQIQGVGGRRHMGGGFFQPSSEQF